MKLNNLKRAVSGAALTLALAFGVTMVASETAQAQYGGYNDPYGRSGGYNDVYQIAAENGYRSGVSHGADHRRQGHRYDATDPAEYRSGTAGYRSEYGNRDAYKQSFREGFRRGYDEGFRGNGGYYGQGNGGYNNGRNDGYYGQGNGGYNNGRNNGSYGRRNDGYNNGHQNDSHRRGNGNGHGNRQRRFPY